MLIASKLQQVDLHPDSLNWECSTHHATAPHCSKQLRWSCKTINL